MESSRSRDFKVTLANRTRNLPHTNAALLPIGLILTPKPSFIHEVTLLAAYPTKHFADI